MIENHDFFIPPAFDALVRAVPVEYYHNVWYGRGGAENAGVENSGAYRKGGKCRRDKEWKAIRRIYSKVLDEIWLSRLSCLLACRDLTAMRTRDCSFYVQLAMPSAQRRC